MKMAIGSTRAGLALKDALIKHLQAKGHQLDDLGMKHGGEFVPYFKVAADIASAVSAGRYAKAIIICGTGAGSAIVANKFRGVYAVQASSQYEAARATIINDANVLTLGEWITPPQHATEIVDSWLAASFGQGFEPDWQKFLRQAADEVRKIEDGNFK
jgi:ribose 5-phosphate isomerase B